MTLQEFCLTKKEVWNSKPDVMGDASLKKRPLKN